MAEAVSWSAAGKPAPKQQRCRPAQQKFGRQPGRRQAEARRVRPGRNQAGDLGRARGR
jgi:hypothetical protein